MSISFEKPIDAKTAALIKEAFGQPEASDDRTFIFNRMAEIDSQVMKKIANEAKQPVTVGLHDVGEIVTMSDGTQYEVTAQGWRKL